MRIRDENRKLAKSPSRDKNRPQDEKQEKNPRGGWPDKTLIVTTVLCLLPMLMGIALYRSLPDRLPSHFDLNGNVNGTMSRIQMVFVLPCVMAALNLLVHIVLEADPKRKNYAPALKVILKWLVPSLTCLMLPLCLLRGLNMDVPVTAVVIEFIGVLFIAMGNYMPKCRQNYTVGIRTPWTLESEENWRKTHHLAGYLWFVCGILLIFTGFGHGNPIVAFAGILVAAFLPCAYSYLLYRKGI